jgi:lipopolysaccharide/colanic/teichoic acid biosynthesis glycosyltransferase
MAIYRAAKRATDVVLAAVTLVLASPLIFAIATAIKLGSRGPVIYLSERVGRGGRPLQVCKFRTMVVDPTGSGPSSTAADDPRVTRVGRWLRRTKLDELPQLVNVLKGEMSLVGPRPQVRWAVDLYTPQQRRTLDVRPGLTDYAFVLMPNEAETLRGSTDPDGDYMRLIHPRKMELTLEYLDRRSFGLDMKILADSVSMALTGKRMFVKPTS